MLELLTGFLFGAAYGNFGSSLQPSAILSIITCFILLVIVRQTKLHKALLARLVALGLIFFGATWGHLHNRPASEQAVRMPATFKVIRGNDHGTLGRYLVVGRGSWLTAQVRGHARRGDYGRLGCNQFGICRFQRSMALHYCRPGAWLQLSRGLRQAFEARLQSIPWEWQGWLQALLLGDWSRLPRSVQENFRHVGLVHLLVLSGFHFGLLFRVTEASLRYLFSPLYVLRLLSPLAWKNCHGLFFCLTMLLGLAYIFTAGLTHPSLRALLVYGALGINRIFLGRSAIGLAIVWALVGQILILPAGFWERSNLLSWAAYLWLLLCFQSLDRSAGWWPLLKNALYCQLGLALLTAPMVGVFSSLGIVANLLVGPIFPVIFLLSLGWLFGLDHLLGSDLLPWILGKFLWVIDVMAAYSRLLILPEPLANLMTVFIISLLICYALGVQFEAGAVPVNEPAVKEESPRGPSRHALD